jgi:hypothetical protein
LISQDGKRLAQSGPVEFVENRLIWVLARDDTARKLKVGDRVHGPFVWGDDYRLSCELHSYDDAKSLQVQMTHFAIEADAAAELHPGTVNVVGREDTALGKVRPYFTELLQYVTRDVQVVVKEEVDTGSRGNATRTSSRRILCRSLIRSSVL